MLVLPNNHSFSSSDRFLLFLPLDLYHLPPLWTCVVLNWVGRIAGVLIGSYANVETMLLLEVRVRVCALAREKTKVMYTFVSKNCWLAIAPSPLTASHGAHILVN